MSTVNSSGPRYGMRPASCRAASTMRIDWASHYWVEAAPWSRAGLWVQVWGGMRISARFCLRLCLTAYALTVTSGDDSR